MKQLVLKHNQDAAARIRTIKRVLWTIFFLNVAVSAAKYGYGLFSHSTSMQADGIHSLFDSAGNIIGLVGMTFASRPADQDHPYGHGKFETYASVAIGLLLLFAAFTVGSEAVQNLMGGTHAVQVTALSFIVMILTLCVNMGVTLYERRIAKRLGSEILAADAKHTLSDVAVSLGVVVGLILVKAGIPVADSVMALVVSAVILYTAWGVFRQANATLSDTARIPSADIAALVCATPGVEGCHRIRTRGTTAEVYVDFHVLVDPLMTVYNAHALAEKLEREISDRFAQVVDVTIHIEPNDEQQREEGRLEG